MRHTSIRYRAQEAADTFEDSGPAVVQMILDGHGPERSQAEIASIVGADHAGTEVGQMAALIRSEGYAVEIGTDAAFPEIERAIETGAIVVIGYARAEDPKRGQYAIVTETDGDTITLADPLTGPQVSLTREAFESRWHDDGSARYGEHMMMAVYPPAEEHAG